MIRRVLRWAGQNGAAVVIAGVIIGLCIPFLSELARPYLSVAIFIFTFGSFLKFDSKSIGSEIANMKRNSLMILWASFGVPLSIVLIMMITRPGPELAQGLLFWALVPVSSSLRRLRRYTPAQHPDRASGDRPWDRRIAILYPGSRRGVRRLPSRYRSGRDLLASPPSRWRRLSGILGGKTPRKPIHSRKS